MTSTSTTTVSSGIDPRGPRFTAAITLVVFRVALLLPDAAPRPAAIITGVQAVLFAPGALAGVQKTPTGLIFRHLIRPRYRCSHHDPLRAIGSFSVCNPLGFESDIHRNPDERLESR